MWSQCTLVVTAALVCLGRALADQTRLGRDRASIGVEEEIGNAQFLQLDKKPAGRPRSLKSEGPIPQSMSVIAVADADSAGLDLQARLGFMYTPTVNTQHPMWDFDWSQLWRCQVVACGFVLFLAGMLCSAGGIGGGGVYVTVLMVVGRLSVRDAVPLSKAVVFVGSISSLILNVRKTVCTKGTGTEKSLIDYNICRLVVPAALLGTYLGVVLNQILPSIAILGLLTIMLVGMTVMVTRTAFAQYAAEQSPQAIDGDANTFEEYSRTSRGRGFLASWTGYRSALVRARPPGIAATTTTTSTSLASEGTKAAGRNQERLRSELTKVDMALALSTLVVVVCSGVFHFHAGRCGSSMHRLHRSFVPECHHPLLSFAGDALQRWMDGAMSSILLSSLSIMAPFIYCALVMTHYTVVCVLKEGWRISETFVYSGTGVFTGCLAGLVGIGGGLIFSPFFLLMNVEPSVAVATSSTCVIFTASSTTMQYLLTDRIIMVLTVAYGAANLLASYVGTKFVHFLQDNYGARKSYITFIVAAGVVISAVLSAYKLTLAQDIVAH